MAIIYAILIYVGVVLLIRWIHTDDSDLSRFKRSGLKLHTDYKTGCQYFSSAYGGVTPRVDKRGKHICIVDVKSTELDPT